MPLNSVRPLVAIAGVAGALALAPATAQQGALVFKNFHRYPTGQWSSEMTGFRGGQPLGPPQHATTCTAPLDPKSANAAMRLGNATASACTMQVIKDEEKTLEYDQVCTVGNGRQVNHMTMHAVDDKTMQVETKTTVANFGETTTRTTMKYLGPCPAGGAAPAPASTAMGGITSADCAQIPEMQRQVDEGAAQCAEVPGQYRAACTNQIEVSKRTVAAVKAQCNR